MLGLTTYQESLRTIGKLLAPSWRSAPTRGEPAAAWAVTEDVARRVVVVSSDGIERTLSSEELTFSLLSSRAQRGTGGDPAWFSDVLRTVGGGLDALDARSVYLEVHPETVVIRCALGDDPHTPIEIAYADEDLEELRTAATAQRAGAPLWDVLVLHGEAPPPSWLKAALVAECAVEVRPFLYARAAAESFELPDLIAAYVAAGKDAEPCLVMLHELRAGAHGVSLPVLLVAEPGAQEPSAACAPLVDEVLRLPAPPVALRSLVREHARRATCAGATPERRRATR